MKFIQTALAISMLLALEAAAQPTPPAPPATPPAPNSRIIQPQVPGQPPGRPGMSPGLPPGMGQPQMATPPKMPDKDTLSYAIGMYFGNNFKRDQLDIDIDTMTTAIKDVMAGKPTRMTDAEVRSTMQQFQMAMRAKMQQQQKEAMEKQGAAAKTEGAAFLAKNATADGVKQLPNGIQYKVLQDGTGDMPKTTDTVIVNYKGSLVNGTTFDQRNGFKTPVRGRTIQGWSEVLPLMKVGSKWEVAIPAALGYGPRGMPPKIPPESVLIFDMELVSIATPTGAAPTAALSSSSSTPVVSGQIIKVPSADGLKRGEKIEVITNAPGQ